MYYLQVKCDVCEVITQLTPVRKRRILATEEIMFIFNMILKMFPIFFLTSRTSINHRLLHKTILGVDHGLHNLMPYESVFVLTFIGMELNAKLKDLI